MIQKRAAGDRGHFNHDWLETYHTFSFADYFDAEQMGFHSLRVINEDTIQPSQGFGTHPHRDMEIITYILEGELEHKDSMGNGSVIRPGDIQRMTAGTGVRHSEFNPSPKNPVHLLQIWILPEKKSLTPGYEEKAFPESERTNQLRLVASRDGSEGSITIHQDAKIFATILAEGKTVAHSAAKDRALWLQVARGSVEINGARFDAGDGAGIWDEASLKIRGLTSGVRGAEFLLFDLAAD